MPPCASCLTREFTRPFLVEWQDGSTDSQQKKGGKKEREGTPSDAAVAGWADQADKFWENETMADGRIVFQWVPVTWGSSQCLGPPASQLTALETGPSTPILSSSLLQLNCSAATRAMYHVPRSMQYAKWTIEP